MEKFIPYEKLSKKKQRELARERRGSWGEINPVSRRVESGKRYNRRKAKQVDADALPSLFSFLKKQINRPNRLIL